MADDLDSLIDSTPAAKPVDLDALIDETPATPHPKMGLGHAAVKGVQDIPTFGFGDEMGAGVQALMQLATHRVTDNTGQPLSVGQMYRMARDENRAESKQAAKDQPVGYYGAGIGAALAPTLLGGAIEEGAGVVGKGVQALGRALAPFRAGKGASLGIRALAGAGNGMVQGALAGAGNSDASALGDLAKDTGRSIAAGGATGAMLPVLGAGVRKVAGPLADKLDEMAINQGRRVLTNGADQLSKRAPVREEAVREALNLGAIKPLSTTAKTLERLNFLTDVAGDHYAEIVQRLQDAGLEGPEAQSLAEQLAAEAAKQDANTLASPVPGLYRNAAEELLTKPVSDEGRLSLTQAENLKRSLQAQAKYGRFEDTLQNEARRDIASRMRQAVEDSIQSQLDEGWTAKSGKLPADVMAAGADFVPTKQRLGNLLEAEAAATRGVARGAQRAHFSMPEKIALLGEAATGPAGMSKAVAGGLLLPTLRQRLPSTAASLGMSMANVLGDVDTSPAYSPLLGYVGTTALGPRARDAMDFNREAKVKALKSQATRGTE